MNPGGGTAVEIERATERQRTGGRRLRVNLVRVFLLEICDDLELAATEPLHTDGPGGEQLAASVVFLSVRIATARP
jgi:hypothetical protein